MVRGLALALLLVACETRNPAFCPHGEDPAGECIRIDAGPECFGVFPFVVCVTPPARPRTLGDVDTSPESKDCDEVVTVGRELCVVKGTDVEIAHRISITGSRPLVILASNALTVRAEGYVDAAATATAAGPGADLACVAGATAGEDSTSGGGGGAGGSFGSRGGNGGFGDGTNGRAGAAAVVVPSLPMLQGGCSGTAGGQGPGMRGEAGGGGGGIYLVAGQTLTIDGTVTASGAGGRGGQASKGGGGGGGSGGMIVLYAPAVEVAASTRIFANGGGGGGGANGGGNGSTGATPTTPIFPAMGGNGPGGNGGNGSFTTFSGTSGTSSPDGGGGGGGGAGAVYILAGDVDAASVSPPPAPR